MKSKEENLDMFKHWKEHLSDRINGWIESLHNDSASKLDFTPQSLDIVGAYLINNFDFESFKEKTDKSIPDAIVSYIGETLRLNLPDSSWKIEVDNPDDLFYNLPVIVYKNHTPISPHSIVSRTLKMKNPNFPLKFYKKRISM